SIVVPQTPKLNGPDSCTRVRACVLASEPTRLDPRVHLRRGDARMPEELLDRAEVRPALEQVGREGVPKRVGRDVPGHRRLAHPTLETPAHVRRREPPAPTREE